MAGWSEFQESAETSAAMMQKYAALASLLLVAALIIPPWIYLTGNLQAAGGRLVYGLADLLSGPVRAASMVVVFLALRERLGARAPRRMTVALLAALLAAGMVVVVACLRAANRQYLLMHPELADELSTMLLTAWGTQVTGVAAAGWHFLGWALLLAGSAGWATGRLPRVLSALYLLAGALSLAVAVLPDMAGGAAALGVVVSIVQAAVLWNAGPAASQAPGAAMRDV